jgi:hypothetical protein
MFVSWAVGGGGGGGGGGSSEASSPAVWQPAVSRHDLFSAEEIRQVRQSLKTSVAEGEELTFSYSAVDLQRQWDSAL